MSIVNDGYIAGATTIGQRNCGHCGERTLCIDIASLTLPPGMTVKATILQDRTIEEPKRVKRIGIGCGCYAKFHRQVVWIQTSMGIRSGRAI